MRSPPIPINQGKIRGVTGEGSVRGIDWVGGLVGLNEGRLTRCAVKMSVQGERIVGGLSGENLGDLNQCLSFGSVQSDRTLGGLVGWNMEGDVTDSYSRALVRDTDECKGGLVGVNMDGTIQRCCYTGFSWETLVGEDYGNIEDCPMNPADTRKQNKLWRMGWDFVDKTGDGTEDIWVMTPVHGPRLAWESADPNQRYSGGSGTLHDPYQIATVYDLLSLSDYDQDWDKNFVLTADIDLSSYTFNRALIAPDEDDDRDGYQGTRFSGNFNPSSTLGGVKGCFQ